MPFVRISLVKGATVDFKHHISQSIHQALIDTFGIPENDLFQIIEELDNDNIIYPPQYLGIPHTEKMIYIRVTAKLGRSTQMKQALYRAIADEIYRRIQHNSNNLVISLIENSKADWSFGKSEAQLVRNH